mgnify:CR=1 FL=1
MCMRELTFHASLNEWIIPNSLVQNIDGRIQANISTKGQLPDSIGADFIDNVMANTKAEIQLADFNFDKDSTIFKN